MGVRGYETMQFSHKRTQFPFVLVLTKQTAVTLQYKLQDDWVTVIVVVLGNCHKCFFIVHNRMQNVQFSDIVMRLYSMLFVCTLSISYCSYIMEVNLELNSALCIQSITPSPEQGVRVWLAVHEDGISVLEHNSVVSISVCLLQLFRHDSFTLFPGKVTENRGSIHYES